MSPSTCSVEVLPVNHFMLVYHKIYVALAFNQYHPPQENWSSLRYFRSFKFPASMEIGNFKKSHVYFEAVAAIVLKWPYRVIFNKGYC